jgi:hypothetical protein
MRGFKPLPRCFYKPSAKVVAPALLGVVRGIWGEHPID